MTFPLSPSRRECHVNRPDLEGLFPVVKRCFQGGTERKGEREGDRDREMHGKCAFETPTS